MGADCFHFFPHGSVCSHAHQHFKLALSPIAVLSRSHLFAVWSNCDGCTVNFDIKSFHAALSPVAMPQVWQCMLGM